MKLRQSLQHASQRPAIKAFGIALLGAFILFAYEQFILPSAMYPLPDRPAAAATGLVVTLLAMALFLWAALTSANWLRLLVFLLFCAGVMTEFGYRFSMRRFSVIEDYHSGLQSLEIDWFKNAALTFLGGRWEVLFPLLGFGLALLLTTRWPKRSPAQTGLSLLAVTLVFVGLYPFTRGTFPTPSLMAAWRTLTFTGLRTLTIYHGPRHAAPEIPHQPPANNIVFIVDESVRADHLSINGYSRATTPYFDVLLASGDLHTWGLAVSASTTSLNSNAALLSGVNQYPDTTQQIYHQPTIFSYAKAIGYRTIYIDAQMSKLWLMSRTDLADVDEWIPASAFDVCPPPETDACAARVILDRLSGSTGIFIWINKIGAHFPYRYRLPDGVAYWQPIADNYGYMDSSVEALVNTYDSLLAYNLEKFFRTIVTPETLKNTVFVYTSDHGQTLRENGETWPHSGPTPNEAMVPMVLIGKLPAPVDTGYKAHHFNLFATLLDLMDVPREAHLYPYSPSLLAAQRQQSAPRFYQCGDMTSAFRGKVLPFDFK